MKARSFFSIATLTMAAIGLLATVILAVLFRDETQQREPAAAAADPERSPS